ncbi:glycosyltransferase family 2 protein [Bifidobacterium felsineum]|uniref:glycosyltransferase family 2 protein n=1 Tax=Bifidobacterium felsineum TaxID=2045440 RepID=UPI001BDCD5E8|nr:glycosyltransferase family 2 protein [Bifidobacterium felsineum]MBT1164908.1 glycosyltransferase family 2 protein [Bifidobacterium felsineum]
MTAKNKICIGIVTFNPDINDIETTLRNIGNSFHVIIVDNGSNNIDSIQKISHSYDCHIITNNENLGIAKALNQIFEFADKNSYEWVLTLDDDSLPPSNMISSFLSMLKGRDNVGIICPMLISKGNHSIFHSKTAVDECITSGSLTNVEAWKSIGGFDEWLFIDSVDFDFSKRLHKAGYVILEDRNVLLPHEIGKTKTINLLVAHPAIRNHSAFRKYYQERNYIYVDYKLHQYSYFIDLLRFMKHVLFVVLWEEDKFEKIQSMIRGRKDGLNKIRELKKEY